MAMLAHSQDGNITLLFGGELPGAVFIETNPHVLISLLFLDFDLFEPTKVALENFYDRIPKGGVIAFDELDNPLWPGGTQAMLQFFEKESLEIRRLPFDPYIGFAIK